MFHLDPLYASRLCQTSSLLHSTFSFSVVSMSSTPNVYTGFWINWSYGRVRGSTITLTAENSAYLIAFIALFVRFAGSQLWSVLTFLVSFARSTEKPQDAVYHQQQAILRNTTQPVSVLWSMLKLSWFWRDTAVRAKSRTALFSLSSLGYIAAFAAAGIFSSKISSTQSEVLLIPIPQCGFWPWPTLWHFNSSKETLQDRQQERAEYFSNIFQLYDKAHDYVSKCYNTTLNSPSEFCLPYGRSQISWSTNSSAECPFEKDLCTADAIQFDSGFINSRTHFGINTRVDDIEYRRVVTCAPITTEGYVSGWVNDSTFAPDILNDLGYVGEIFLRYTYGQNNMFSDNTTFAYNKLSWSSSLGSGIVPSLYQLK